MLGRSELYSEQNNNNNNNNNNELPAYTSEQNLILQMRASELGVCGRGIARASASDRLQRRRRGPAARDPQAAPVNHHRLARLDRHWSRQVSSRAFAQDRTVALFSRLSPMVACAGTERIVFSITSSLLDRTGSSIEMFPGLQLPG